MFLSIARGGQETNSAADFKPDPNALKPYQTVSLGEPPLSPMEFNPDTGTPPVRPHLFDEPGLILRLTRTQKESRVLPPAVFNPDPGAAYRTNSVPEPFFTNNVVSLSDYDGAPVPEALALPRTDLFRNDLEVYEKPKGPPYGSEPVPDKLKLPRRNVRRNLPIPSDFRTPDYPLSAQGLGYPSNSVPEPNRWRIGFAPWRRYTSGETETPYESPETLLWHPYYQSLLKGDSPIIGQDIFLDLTASSETEFEGRRTPTPSGVSSSQPESSEFFGQSESLSVVNNFSFSVDLFQGETVFKPVDWAIHLQPVYNITYLQTHNTGVVNVDPRGLNPGNNAPPPNNSGVINPGDVGTLLNGQIYAGPSSLLGNTHTTRTTDYLSLQEAFVEFHLADLSDNYDFMSLRIGNQPFNSDFRGFLFNEINLGIRLFGNIDNNRYQYNFAVFDMREKDTDSQLNSFDARNQYVFLANLYRQDFLWHGYTAQLSFTANLDNGDIHYDKDGFLVRPAPLGTVVPHSVQSYYLGWAGDGHIGRLNISHQVYEVLGHDDFNGLAGHPVDINAQMAALELSYDRDWVRYKASVFYASGDHNTQGGTASGFDTVVDNPNFTGGPFSYWARQGIGLAGTDVNLKQDNSLVPDLRTSKTEGQANFVNPGVLIVGPGLEMDLTPKLRSFLNANYVRFMETDPLKTALFTDKVAHEVGWDLSIGFQYRPLLTDNVIVSAGFGALIPGSGYRDIYQTSTIQVPGYTTASPGHVDDFLYSGIFAVTFTY